jgi:DNA-binding NarL/FixJ family response regulator
MKSVNIASPKQVQRLKKMASTTTMEIRRMFNQGQSKPEIARRLCICIGTVNAALCQRHREERE